MVYFYKKVYPLTLLNILASCFLFLCFVLPRSYSFVKAPFLAIFVLLSLFIIGLKIRPNVLFFYVVISLVGLIGIGQGLVSGGAVEGIFDSFRLWVIWSFVLFVFFNYFSYVKCFDVIDTVVVWAGISISLINITFSLSSYIGYDVFPASVRENLELRVGFHSSYIQLTAHNIGMLFFITPYLIGKLYFKNVSASVGWLHTVSLFLCLVTVMISGRRALWAVTFVSFFSIFFVSIFTLRKSFVNSKYAFSLLVLVVLCGPFLATKFDSFGFYNHFESAFSAKDERSIQSEYLVNGFLENPIFGQGFGSYAGYTRNNFSPWSYEMTYHQLIFNVGVFGFICIFLLCSYFFILGFKSCHKGDFYGTEKVSALFGLLGIIVGAYSNPYFGSFDFMILLGLLPLVSLKQRTPIS